jgi:hypothetical protein
VNEHRPERDERFSSAAFGDGAGGVLDLPTFGDSCDGESLRGIGGSAEPRQIGREWFTRLMQRRELL